MRFPLRFTEAKASAERVLRVLIVGYDRGIADAFMTSHCHEATIDATIVNTLAAARQVFAQRKKPIAVVILKHQLPDGLGEHLLPDIEAYPRQPTAMILGAAMEDLLLESLQYRPVAIPTSTSTSALVRIVQSLSNGYAGSLLRRFASNFKLTTRESEALVSLAQGRKAKEIADRMRCSEPTVYCHLRRICQKTKSKDCSEVMASLFAYACQAHGHTPLEYAATKSSQIPL